jgi:dienelactone hydrolase
VLIVARRGITFLEQQPEVDPAKIGVYGHSMGGKLTTNLAAIDKRVRAAVPSCGGSGIVLESQTDLPGCVKSSPSALELACVSDNPYIDRLTCPILWLSPTNDFHAVIDNMAVTWREVPDERVRFSISPHFNHHHGDDHLNAQHLWFEQHLKGGFSIPASPAISVELKATDGVPVVTVRPDRSRPVKRVARLQVLLHRTTDGDPLGRRSRSVRCHARDRGVGRVAGDGGAGRAADQQVRPEADEGLVGRGQSPAPAEGGVRPDEGAVCGFPVAAGGGQVARRRRRKNTHTTQ